MAARQRKPDGGVLSKAETFTLAGQLSRLGVHISADIEDSSSDDPADVAGLVAQLADLGVAGITLEDSAAGHLVAPAVAAARIPGSSSTARTTGRCGAVSVMTASPHRPSWLHQPGQPQHPGSAAAATP